MESKNFTYDMDHKLIELVKRHPYLYKSTEKNFRDIALRDQVWNEISRSMSRTVPECKTRWRTMRDSYRKNKKKVKVKNGAPSRSKYDDDILRFLDDVPPKRRRKAVKVARTPSLEDGPVIVGSTSLAVECDEHVVALEEEVSAGEEDLGEDDTNDFKVMLYRAQTPHLDKSDSGCSNLPHSSFVEPAAAEAVALDEMRKDIDGRFRVLQERLLSERRSERTEHAVEIFFRSMASTVMTFSPHLIAEAKNRVCKIISELELRNITEDSRDFRK